MDMHQHAHSLIDFFKSYTFGDYYSIIQKLDINNKLTEQDLKQYLQISKNIISKLQSSLQVSIMSACKLIDIFKQQQQHKISQHDFLNQQYVDLKQIVKEDKKQTEKFLQESRQIIQELKKQLLQKEEQNREICDKLQERQLYINSLKKEQKIFNDKNEELAKSCKQFQQKCSQNGTKIEEMQKDIEEYATQLEAAQEINQKIYAENQYLKTINEQLLKKIEKITENSNQQINQEQFQNQSHNNSMELDDESSVQKDHRQSIERFIQIHDMNASLGNPNVLKDVLNISQQNSRFLNMTRQFLRSKQKQNWGQNFMINDTNSSKNDQIIEENYFNANQVREKFSYDEEAKVLTSQQNNKKTRKYFRQIKQFTMNDFSPQQIGVDPYFAFFTLSIQCVKINSKNFEQVAGLDIDSDWSNIIERRIPMNQWQEYIKAKILQKSGIQV